MRNNTPFLFRSSLRSIAQYQQILYCGKLKGALVREPTTATGRTYPGGGGAMPGGNPMPGGLKPGGGRPGIPGIPGGANGIPLPIPGGIAPT
jgi:hypothetical protein